LGEVMTLELESMMLGIDLLGLDQLIRADQLLKPPMLLAFQLDQLQLMTLEMELAKMLAPKLVALDLDPLLLALESDLPHMDLALWDQLDFE
jgi:hypothetical protein